MKSVGTSGFQYPEWKGKFYPADLSVAKMLGYYARHFSTTEINYSFRRIPSPQTIQKWSEATPPGFTFSFKAPQKVTHFAKLRNCGDTIAYFYSILSEMGEKLGPVLFQLPPTFTKDLQALRECLAVIPQGRRVAFEFRHESWFSDDVWTALRKHNAALCVAEDENLTTPFVATADFGYLRPRREDYKAGDIKKLARAISGQDQQWTDAYIYFKHEEHCVGPKFANQLKVALETSD